MSSGATGGQDFLIGTPSKETGGDQLNVPTPYGSELADEDGALSAPADEDILALAETLAAEEDKRARKGERLHHLNHKEQALQAPALLWIVF